MSTHALDVRRGGENLTRTVAQTGKALRFASKPLQYHPALQLISASDLAHEASKLRLAFATCLLYRQPTNSAASVSVLSRDVVELTGAKISRDAVVEGLARRHHYWSSVPTNTTTTLAPNLGPARKKRKGMTTK